MTKKVLQNLHTNYVPEVLINSKHIPKGELSQEARKIHVPGSVSLLSDIVQEKKSEQQKHLVERKWEADENDDNITSSTEDEDAHIEVVVK
jgi:hypothetical protein